MVCTRLLLLLVAFGCHPGPNIITSTVLYFAIEFVQSPKVRVTPSTPSAVTGMVACFFFSTLIQMVVDYTIRQAHKARTTGQKEQALLEFSTEGVLLLSEDCTTVKFSNAAALKLLGNPQVTLVTHNGWKLSRFTDRKFVAVDLAQEQVVQAACQDGTPLEELLQTMEQPPSDGRLSAAFHFSMEQG